MTFGARTVTFGADIATLSLRGALEVSDGSRLRIGDEDRQVIGGSDRDDGLFGGAGDDRIWGGRGHDLLQGNSGDDELHGGAGSNTLYGGQGNDVLYASEDGETLGSFAQGNLGDDEIYGGAGADTLQSGGGADSLRGGDGNDLIVIDRSGGATAEGGAGNDTIVAGAPGQNVLIGGEGRDMFELATAGRPMLGRDDVIADWESHDQIHFIQVGIGTVLPQQYSEFVAADYASALSAANGHIAGAGATWVAAQVGADVIVFANTDGDAANGADTAVRLLGRSLADIGLENFI